MSFDDHRDPGDETDVVAPVAFGLIPASGGLAELGFVPRGYLRFLTEETLKRESERIGRNIAAEAKARAACDTGYLRESSLGGLHHYVPFTPPPTRRVRARRAIAEARRRLSEAFLVVRTGSTSYENDD